MNGSRPPAGGSSEDWNVLYSASSGTAPRTLTVSWTAWRWGCLDGAQGMAFPLEQSSTNSSVLFTKMNKLLRRWDRQCLSSEIIVYVAPLESLQAKSRPSFLNKILSHRWTIEDLFKRKIITYDQLFGIHLLQLQL